MQLFIVGLAVSFWVLMMACFVYVTDKSRNGGRMTFLAVESIIVGIMAGSSLVYFFFKVLQ